jgi:hypothetical protein
VWLQNLVTRTELARHVGGFDPTLRFGDDDDFAFRLGCQTRFCFVNMPMVLIDRTPPAQRHVGASKNWDDEGFRLRMAQKRMEKRLPISEHLPRRIRNLIRQDLAAVYSGWANLFLQNKEYGRARDAVTQAVSLHLTPNLAVKWCLTQLVPKLARKAVWARDQRRSRQNVGIG